MSKRYTGGIIAGRVTTPGAGIFNTTQQLVAVTNGYWPSTCWVYTATRPGGTYAANPSLARDSAGNLYVLGTWTLGTTYVHLSKFNPAGVHQWTQQLSTATSTHAGLVIDSNDNIYVIYYASAVLYLAVFGTTGTLAIVRSFTNATYWQNWSGMRSLAVDSTSLYIAGYYTGTDSNGDFSCTRVNLAGFTSAYSKIFSRGNSYDGPGQVTVDGNGNAFHSGYFQNYSGNNTYSIFVKLNSSGVAQWSRLVPVEAASYNHGIVADSAGNCYFSASPYNTGYYFLVKFDPSGTILWQYKVTPPAGFAQGDFFGRIGSSGDLFYLVGNQLVRITSAGTIVWQRTLGSTSAYLGNLLPTDFILDSSENIYMVYGTQIIKYLGSGPLISGVVNGSVYSMTASTATLATSTLTFTSYGTTQYDIGPTVATANVTAASAAASGIPSIQTSNLV